MMMRTGRSIEKAKRLGIAKAMMRVPGRTMLKATVRIPGMSVAIPVKNGLTKNSDLLQVLLTV